MQALSPDLNDLNLVNLGSDWLLDESSSTAERTVLYYSKLLYSEDNKADGATTTSLFADSLTIDDKIASKVTQNSKTENGYTIITTTYDYDGVQFQIKATVDAVQEHNAEDAIWSAWGRRVTVSNGILSLAE